MMHTNKDFTQVPALETIEALQSACFDVYQDKGLPNHKLESWKYTPSRWLTQKRFELSYAASKEDVAGFWQQMPNVIYVKGDQVTHQVAEKGVYVWSLKEGVVDPTFEQMFSHLKPRETHALFEANSAMVRNGVCIVVAEKARLEHPLYVVYQAPSDQALTYVRTMVFAAEFSNAKVVEVFASNHQDYYTNAVFQAQVGSQASLTHVRYQNEAMSAYHTGFVLAAQNKASHFDTFSLSMGAKIARQDVEVQLIGRGAHCGMYGVNKTVGEQVSDHHTLVHHQVSHCTSDEYFKGVLFDQSHVIFEGKVVVDQDAQKTDAKQMNRNLILSDQAHVDTAPQLEIFADDVKCAHGATIGKLDPDQLFYLRSRGIDPEQAQRMLIRAFIGEVLDGLPIKDVTEHAAQWLMNTTSEVEKK